jgi:Integrase core domain
MVGTWKEEYNEERPHSSLGYLTPLEELAKAKVTSSGGLVSYDPVRGARGQTSPSVHLCAISSNATESSGTSVGQEGTDKAYQRVHGPPGRKQGRSFVIGQKLSGIQAEPPGELLFQFR